MIILKAPTPKHSERGRRSTGPQSSTARGSNRRGSGNSCVVEPSKRVSREGGTVADDKNEDDDGKVKEE